MVYAHDPRDRRKQDISISALDALIASDEAVLSAQCLSEFFAVVTRRLPEPMSPSAALEQMERLAGTCDVVAVTAPVALEAARGAVRHGLSLWGAIIWATAKLDQVPLVLTEDAEHGRVIEGVRYHDPFDPRSRLADLVAP